jgi:UDP:flavonoid glycosyltransferase YjiC (YdhE family)
VVRTRTGFYDLANRVLEELPHRAIFLVGPDRTAAARRKFDRPEIHIADYEPYSRLFPRAATIVHQCGMGTTAQASRSGRPQILVPFAHDQYDNAERVRRHTGAAVVFSRRLSARRLGAALRTSLSDEVARRAEQLGRKLQAEDFDSSFLEAIGPYLKNA